LGFAYLSLITDAYQTDCELLFASLDQRRLFKSAGDGLAAAKSNEADSIHHSDRGNQHCSFLYIRKLKEAGIAISMRQYGDPYENAIAERVNSILKTDFRLNQVFTSFEEAARAVETSIHNYNHLRPYMSCDYLTPAAAHSKDKSLKKHWKPSVIIVKEHPLNLFDFIKFCLRNCQRNFRIGHRSTYFRMRHSVSDGPPFNVT
jgi:putative transposase